MSFPWSLHRIELNEDLHRHVWLLLISRQRVVSVTLSVHLSQSHQRLFLNNKTYPLEWLWWKDVGCFVCFYLQERTSSCKKDLDAWWVHQDGGDLLPLPENASKQPCWSQTSFRWHPEQVSHTSCTSCTKDWKGFCIQTPPCLCLSSISDWCPPWTYRLLTRNSRWLSSTFTGLHASLYLSDKVLEMFLKVLQIACSYFKKNNDSLLVICH